MKKFKRIISGFLAAALVLTQSLSTAYSEDLPGSAITTTMAVGAPEDDDASAGETDGTQAPEGDDTSADTDAPTDSDDGTQDEDTTGADTGTGSDSATADDEDEEEETKPLTDEELRQSIDEKKKAAVREYDGMGIAIPLTEEEMAYEQRLITKDYARVGASTTVSKTADGVSKYSSDYYYNTLNEVDKGIYDNLYATVDNYAKSSVSSESQLLPIVFFSTDYSVRKTIDEVWQLVNRFYFSNPQFFFIARGFSYRYIGSPENDIVGFSILLNPRYCNYSARSQYQRGIDSTTSTWLTQIGAKKTPLAMEREIAEKLCAQITYTHRYLVDGVEYNNEAPDGAANIDQDIGAALVDGKCVCNGYALAFQYFCNAVGIDAITVSSTTHAWSIVNLYGKWYETDVTWMDQDNYGTVNYKWFNKSHSTVLTNDTNSPKSHIYDTKWTGIVPETPADMDTSTVRELQGISILTQPTKLTYTTGERFDPTGCTIELIYSTNETETIALPYTGTDHTVTMYPSAFTSATDKSVYITCDGFGASVPVSVTSNEVDKVEITKEPSFNAYVYGSEFTIDGKLTVSYKQGDPVVVDMANAYATGALKVSGFNSYKLGKQTITLTYAGFSFQRTVFVIVDPVDPPVVMFWGKPVTDNSNTIIYNALNTTPIIVFTDDDLREMCGVDTLTKYDLALINYVTLNVTGTKGGESVTKTFSFKNEDGIWRLEILAVNEPIFHEGEFAPYYFDNLTSVAASVTFQASYFDLQKAIADITENTWYSILARHEDCASAAAYTIPATATNVTLTAADGVSIRTNTLTANTNVDVNCLILPYSTTQSATDITIAAGKTVDVQTSNKFRTVSGGANSGFMTAVQHVDPNDMNSTPVKNPEVEVGTFSGVANLMPDASGGKNLVVTGKITGATFGGGNIELAPTVTQASFGTFAGHLFNNSPVNVSVTTLGGWLTLGGASSKATVNSFAGALDLETPTSEVTITTLRDGSGINMTALVSDGHITTLPKVTVTHFPTTGTPVTITVNNADTTFLPSGITLINTTEAGTFADGMVTVTNKMTGGEKDLGVFKYGTEIRAEDAGALTLKVNDVEVGNGYPSFAKAFEAMQNYQPETPGEDVCFAIYMRHSMEVTSFTLPTSGFKATGKKSLLIGGNGYTLTLNGVSSITAPYSLELSGITLVPLTAAGAAINTFNISTTGAGSYLAVLNNEYSGKLNLTSSGDVKAWGDNIGTIKTTNTAGAVLELHGDTQVDNITGKFSVVYINNYSDLTITGTAGNITSLALGDNVKDCSLCVYPTATVNIGTIEGRDDLSVKLYADTTNGIKLPTVTVTDITGDECPLHVFDVKDADETTPEHIGLSAGVTLLKTASTSSDYSLKINLANQTESKKNLFVVKVDKDIRTALWGHTVFTLNVNEDNEDFTQLGETQYFDTLDEVYAHIVKDKVNTIGLQDNYVADKFVLPDSTAVGTGKVKFNGAHLEPKDPDDPDNPDGEWEQVGVYSLTLPGTTTLSFSYPVEFEDIIINSRSAGVNVAALTISSSKYVKLDSVKFGSPTDIKATGTSKIELSGVCENIRDIIGTANAELNAWRFEGAVRNVDTFKLVSVWPAEDEGEERKEFDLTGAMKGVVNFEGTIYIASPTASAKINNISDYSAIYLTASKNNGKYTVGTVTISTVSDGKWLRIVIEDEDKNLIQLPSGFQVLTAGGTTDFTSQLTIDNKLADESGNTELTPHKYDTAIRAEYDGAVWLTIIKNNTELSNEPYPSIEAALTHIDTTAENYITVNTDTVNKSLNVNKALSAGLIKIQADSDENEVLQHHKLTLVGNSFSTITSQCDLYFEGLEFEFFDSAGVPISAVTFSQTKGNFALLNTTVAGDTVINVTNSATVAGTFVELTNDNSVKFGTLQATRTNTVDLLSNGGFVEAVNIKNFRKVGSWTNDPDFKGTFYVRGSLTGVTNLAKADITLMDPASVSEVTNVTDDSFVVLNFQKQQTGAFKPAKFTLTDIAEGKKLELMLATIVQDDGIEGYVRLGNQIPVGTEVMYAKNTNINFADRVKIHNTALNTQSTELEAYKYDTTIRAEIPGQITLRVFDYDPETLQPYDEDHPLFERNYPSLELAINDLKADKKNYLILNQNVTIDSTFPKTKGTSTIIEFQGPFDDENEDGYFDYTPVIDFNGASTFDVNYTLCFNNVSFRSVTSTLAPVSTFTIKSSKNLLVFNSYLANDSKGMKMRLGLGGDGYLGVAGLGFEIYEVFGTSKKGWFEAQGDTTVYKITNIGGAEACVDKENNYRAILTVTGPVTSVNDLCGTLLLKESASIDVNSIHGAWFYILKSENPDYKIPSIKTNYFDVYREDAEDNITQFCVVENGADGLTPVQIEDGTKFMTIGCSQDYFNQQNYTSYINIKNKNLDGGSLNAFYYSEGTNKGAIVAQNADALTLEIYNNGASTPSVTAKYPNFELAFKAVQKGKSNIITVNKDIDVPAGKFVLPTLNATDTLTIKGNEDISRPMITFYGIAGLTPSYSLVLKNLTLDPRKADETYADTFNIKPTGSLYLDEVGDSGTVKFNLSAGANSVLTLKDVYFTISEITGTNTTVLNVNSNSGADKVTTFKSVVLNYRLIIVTSISGIGTLETSGNSELYLKNTATANITTLGNGTNGATVFFEGSSSGIAALTVGNIGTTAKIIVGAEGNPISADTKLFTMTCSEKDFYEKGYSGKIIVGNTLLPDGNTLNAFYYPEGSNKGAILAQDASALTLMESGEEIGNYPNPTLAFKAMSAHGRNEEPRNYTLVLNKNIETDTFTLPALAVDDSLTFTSADTSIGNFSNLTIKGLTSLTANYQLKFDHVTVDTFDKDGNRLDAFELKNTNAAAKVTLDRAGFNSKVNFSITGTAEIDAKGGSTFGTFAAANNGTLIVNDNNGVQFADITGAAVLGGSGKLVVTRNITGAKELKQGTTLRLDSSYTTATIAEINGGSVILSGDYGGTIIPSLTVTKWFRGELTVIYAGDPIPVTSGTALFNISCDENAFYRDSMVDIVNKTAEGDDGKELTAIYYKSGNKGEIRAEYADAVTLTLHDENGGEVLTRDYPTLELALKSVKKDRKNTITLKKSLEVSSIALPSGLGSGFIMITADQTADTKPTLTFKGMTRLSAQCNIFFFSIELKFLDRSGNELDTFDISSTSELDMSLVKTATKLNISSTGEKINISGCDLEIGTISGTQNKTVLAVGDVLTADTVSGFTIAYLAGAFTVNTTLSSVSTLRTNENGSLVLKPTATATIGTIESWNEEPVPGVVTSYPANIVLCAEQNEDGSIKKLATLTVSTDITSKGGVKANVFVKDADASALIPVPSGTKLFTFSGTEQKFNAISGNMQIVNTTTGDDSTKETYDGNKLDPFYYSREIRAEYAGMLTLSYNDPTTNERVEVPCPNFEKAFAAVKPGSENLITVNENIDVPAGKFVLPTTLSANDNLTIMGKGGSNKTLTLHNVAGLSPRYRFMLNNVTLDLRDRNNAPIKSGKFTINGSGNLDIGYVTIDPGITVDVTVGAKSIMTLSSNNCSFGTLTGTSSSVLNVLYSAEEADKVTTFGGVSISCEATLTVKTSMTGVKYLGTSHGTPLILPSTATATITSIGMGGTFDSTVPNAVPDDYRTAEIVLLDDEAAGIKLAKLTVANVVKPTTFTVKNADNTALIAVPNGTPLFTFSGTVKAFETKDANGKDCTDKLTITNKTTTNAETSKTLNAYAYGSGSTCEVRAEYAGALTLEVSDPDTYDPVDGGGYFPSFEKAFAHVVPGKNNVIRLEENIDAKVFTLPTNIGNGSLFICGTGTSGSERHKLTLHGITSLAPRYEFTFDTIELIPRNSKGDAQVPTFTITGAASKDIGFYKVKCSDETTINLTAAANGIIGIHDFNECKIGTISGTNTSTLGVLSGSAGTIDKITNFKTVAFVPSVTVNSSITGVGELMSNGALVLPTTATATITQLGGLAEGEAAFGANIVLLAETEEGKITKLPNLTVSKLNAADSTITVKDSTAPSGDPIAIPSGTKLFTFSGTVKAFETKDANGKDCTDKLTITNKTTTDEVTGKTLNAYAYGSGSTCEVRAEYTGALKLVAGTYTDYFPSFEKAFAHTVAGMDNIITLNENVDAKVFTLPTNLGTEGALVVCSTSGKTLTLHGITSLAPRYDFTLDTIELIPLNSKGDAQVPTFEIKGSKSVDLVNVKCNKDKTTINASAGASSKLYVSTCDSKLGTLTGTATSALHIINTECDRIATFKEIYVADGTNKVNTSITGVTSVFGGEGAKLVLAPTATATINTLGTDDFGANIVLLAETEEGKITKLPNLTVSKLHAAESTITVMDKNMNVNTGIAMALASGTKLFTFSGTVKAFDDANYTALITIGNKTTTNAETGKTLNAYAYGSGSTCEVRAEYEGALELAVLDPITRNLVEGGGPFPSFEKAFAHVVPGMNNGITLNEDVDAKVFTLPTNIGNGSLIIYGGLEKHKLTLHGITSLAPKYTFELNSVELTPLNSKGDAQVPTFTISGSKDVELNKVTCDKDKTTINLTVGAGGTLRIYDNDSKFGTLTGTATSALYIRSTECDRIATFKEIHVLNGTNKVNTSITGVTTVYGPEDATLVLAPTATATITQLGGKSSGGTDIGANIVLLAETEDGKITKLPNLTVTKLADNGQPINVTVKSAADNAVIAVPSGTKLFTFSGTVKAFETKDANDKDYTDRITIGNKTTTDAETGKTLNAYAYGSGSTCEVRAEYAGALTLSVNNGAGTPFPSFEKAFANTVANKINEIKLNENVDAKVFTLPTNIGNEGTLSINGNYTLTLHNITSLAPRYDFILSNVELIPLNSKGDAQVPTFEIKGSKRVDLVKVKCNKDKTTINLTVGAGETLRINNNDIKFGTLTGTATSALSIRSTECDRIAMFKEIFVADGTNKVNTSITGVTTVYGLEDAKLVLAPTATATINTLGKDDFGADIVLLAETEDGKITKLPNLTVTKLADNGQLINVTVNNADYRLASGTKVLTAGSNTDIAEGITIVNKDANGNDLTAVTYGREIRAEIPDVIVLNVNNSEVGTFTSFEKMFTELNRLANADRQNANKYEIVMKSDIMTKVFTLPTYGKSITVKSDDNTKRRKLIIVGVNLNYKNYPVNFETVDVTIAKS